MYYADLHDCWKLSSLSGPFGQILLSSVLSGSVNQSLLRSARATLWRRWHQLASKSVTLSHSLLYSWQHCAAMCIIPFHCLPIMGLMDEWDLKCHLQRYTICSHPPILCDYLQVCHDRCYLSTLLRLRLHRLRGVLNPIIMAYASMEFGNLLLHDVGLTRLPESVCEFGGMGWQCDQPLSRLVWNMWANPIVVSQHATDS